MEGGAVDGAEEGGVPEGPGRAIAVASALAVGAALTAAAGRAAPSPAVVSRAEGRSEQGAPPGRPQSAPPGRSPPRALSPGAAALLRVVRGLRSEDPVERRETAGVVERLVADPDAGARLDLASALAALGGRESVLPLRLLAGDEDPWVRVEARQALLAGGRVR